MKKLDKNHELAVELWNHYPDRVLLNEPLRKHTTYKVGGPATALCIPRDREELQDMLSFCTENEVPVFILGSGSNILVHDRGLEQVVIKLDRCCSERAQMEVLEITDKIFSEPGRTSHAERAE